MRNAVPTLGPSIQALLDAMGSLRAQGVQCIPTVDSTLLWTLPLQSGLQKRIHSELVANRRTAAMASLPTGEPRNGLGVLRPLTTDESAIRRQGIINMTCRDSSQWLDANSAYLFNRMNNEAFTLAYKRRSMHRLMGSRTNCVCGALRGPRPGMPTSYRYATLATAMLAMIFAIFLSPVRMLGNTTLLTAKHSWIATSNASMSQRSTQTTLIVERILH